MIPDHALLTWAPTERSEADALVSAVQARAQQLGVALPKAPEAPTSCCGRGCSGCVWLFYYSEVSYWRDEAMLRCAD